MVHLMIDGQSVEVPEGTMILEAAQQADIHIPTLCYHEDQKIKAVCRICVVEVEGSRALSTACSTPVMEGMVIHTASPKVLKARKNLLELIFSRHPQNCLVCSKSGKCDLQKIAQDMGMHEQIHYDIEYNSRPIDKTSPSIVRDISKCVLCGRCLETCNEIQEVHVLSKENRGFSTLIAPGYGLSLGDTCCINCGQCYQVCPVGSITIHDDTDEIWKMKMQGKKLVVQVAPSVRINLAEAMGEDPGVVSTGRLVTALKRLGFDNVFDSDFSADLTIMEEGTELLQRVQNGGTLPMFTSCCPAWVKYCETYMPEFTDHLSTAKSPQQMFGPVIKTWFAEKSGIDPEEICSISVMPCTAKKYECKRPEMNASGYQDVDISITVQELANMIQTGGIDFSKLPDTEFDNPFGTGSGAGLIFGATGGVMEAALRTVYSIVMGKEMEPLEYTPVRGFEGIKESSVELGDLTVKVAVAHGIKNARALIDEIRAGNADFHFVEIMACPGGCIGGGGNAIRTWKKVEKRKEAIYEAEKDLPVRLSHKNPAITQIYEEFLTEPCGEKSHHLLHTTYFNRQDLLR